MRQWNRVSTNVRAIVLSLLYISLISTTGSAQDTVRYHIGTQVGIASQNYLPHWLTANRFGVLDNQEYAVGLLRAGAAIKHQFTKRLSVGAEIDLIAKRPFITSQSPDLAIQQGYLQVGYGIFSLTAGRQERTLGSQAEDLSTGSFSLSGNARPIPQVLLAVPDYSSVPFTRGFAEFKGTYEHAWLGQERHIDDAFLHGKSFYLRLGGDYRINLAGGLAHYAIWGGDNHRGGKLPSGFKDYLKIITAQSADATDNDILPGEVTNVLGSNLGVYDLNILFKTTDYHFTIYQQTPFEDKSGNNPFNKDRLLGIQVTNQRPNAWLSSIVYEFVSTRHQSGPSRPGGVDDGPGSKDRFGLSFGGRDNYYNNYLYRTGWVYQGRIIGTPLFYTKARMKQYVPGFTDPDEAQFNLNVVNNRVVAHHVGVQGQVRKIKYRMLSTYTINYGTYGGINGGINKWGSVDQPDAPYAFRPPKHQSYFLLEVETHPFSNLWSLTTSLATDVGELTDNIGILVGLKRRGILEIK